MIKLDVTVSPAIADAIIASVGLGTALALGEESRILRSIVHVNSCFDALSGADIQHLTAVLDDMQNQFPAGT